MDFLRSRAWWDRSLVLILGMACTIYGGVVADWRDDPAGLELATRPVDDDPSRDLAQRTRGKGPQFQRPTLPTPSGSTARTDAGLAPR